VGGGRTGAESALPWVLNHRDHLSRPLPDRASHTKNPPLRHLHGRRSYVRRDSGGDGGKNARDRDQGPAGRECASFFYWFPAGLHVPGSEREADVHALPWMWV
jgi:hypothetical protein